MMMQSKAVYYVLALVAVLAFFASGVLMIAEVELATWTVGCACFLLLASLWVWADSHVDL